MSRVIFLAIIETHIIQKICFLTYAHFSSFPDTREEKEAQTLFSSMTCMTHTLRSVGVAATSLYCSKLGFGLSPK